MVYRDAGQRYPIAAYLYVLHLDGPALAWEYLRRNPDYRRDWADRLRQGMAGNRWGLCVLEDPALDARDAHPIWLTDQPGLVQLYPDLDPMPGATAFDVWSIPGRKSLIHDGCCLRVTACLPGGRVRLGIAHGLKHGDAFVVAMRPSRQPRDPLRALAAALDELAAASVAAPMGQTFARPSPTALLDVQTLQALDANLAGASLREVAVEVFGRGAVTHGWHADAGLRSKVRRLVRRGRTLMLDGYRSLAQIDRDGEGRFDLPSQRP
ncbi:MAG: DNA -binding domain-containing protein [Pseudomonadales bacterium]